MGFFDKLKRSIGGVFMEFTGGNEEFYDELEESLILADAGADTALKSVSLLRDKVRDENLFGAEEVKSALTDILADMLKVDDGELRLTTKPSVILMVGVNGVGKTTTIGKLASRLTAEGKKVLLAAADTFRAAAAEQLTVWAERSDTQIVRHEEGSDPASVVFDAVAASKARGVDVMIVDTAGRLHNKQNLMAELAKMRRIITRELPEADVETLLVIDATTGQNGLIQAREFAAAADITGIVLTKLDGTAKGGIVFSIARDMKVPVKLVGLGEGIDDLIPFDPKGFCEALLK